jgi:hypothetical protein
MYELHTILVRTSYAERDSYNTGHVFLVSLDEEKWSFF